jgi:3-phosphoshikimate 1-carboxyvinyltransferase
MKLHVTESKLSGEAGMPASKSHTIRGLLIAGLASGTSRLIEPLRSADTAAAMAAMNAFGADIVEDGSDLIISGVTGGPAAAKRPIDVGNSGTTLYIACATAALSEGNTTLTGDRQIQARPVQPLLDALEDLGADAKSTKGNGCAPVEITGPMEGGIVQIECPTSQYLTALLLN